MSQFQAILPASVDLLVRSLPCKPGHIQRVRFSYVERFRPSQVTPGMRKLGLSISKVIDATFRACSQVGIAGVRAVRYKDGIGLYGVTSQQMLGDMMTGEFMMWSRLGDMRLRDIMIGSFAGALRAGQSGHGETDPQNPRDGGAR